MRLSDSVLDVLDKYKYQNLPLEETISRLAEATGCYSVSPSKKDDLALLLCEYKWNRLTKLSLAEKVSSLGCFQQVVIG